MPLDPRRSVAGAWTRKRSLISHRALVSLTRQKRLRRLSESAVWQVRLSEVRRQIDPDSRSSCTEGSIAEVGVRPTWQEAFECQPSAVFLGGRRWRGSSRQLGSWEHAQTTPGGQPHRYLFRVKLGAYTSWKVMAVWIQIFGRGKSGNVNQMDVEILSNWCKCLLALCVLIVYFCYYYYYFLLVVVTVDMAIFISSS